MTCHLVDVAPVRDEPGELASNVKALQGVEGVFRLRVGDWRMVFTEDGAVIAIVRIAPRGGAYE